MLLDMGHGSQTQGVIDARSKAIEQELLAPCCWAQTLDVHDSDIARELRHEIAERVSAGETAASIESALVARFGERMVAVPTTSPLPWVAPTVMVLLVLLAVALIVKAHRWVGRSREAGAHPDTLVRSEQASDYDAQIERELDAFEC